MIIPNLDFRFFTAEDVLCQNIIDDCGHGIFPPILDLLRPVLLIDYIATDLNDMDEYGVPLLLADDSLLLNLCSWEELSAHE